jgi:hypothetical protein
MVPVLALIVINHTRPDSRPSLTMVFPTLLWLCMEPQDSEIPLLALTAPKILW